LEGLLLTEPNLNQQLQIKFYCIRMNYKATILTTLLLSVCINLLGQTSALIADGFQKLDTREYNESIKVFLQVLGQEPNNTEALSGVIRAFLLSENLREAQKYIDNALKEHPNNPEFYLRRGILNNMRGQFRRAIPDFNRALELSVDNIDIQIYINRGVSNMQDQNFGDAIADFSDALKINPRSISALNYRAFTNYQIGNFSESISDYDKSIDLNPENAMGYYNRGMAHLRSGDRIKACSDFHQSCSRGNKNACRMIVTECSGVR
jgi:tetratricopeptide (TPR) repeat protein